MFLFSKLFTAQKSPSSKKLPKRRLRSLEPLENRFALVGELVFTAQYAGAQEDWMGGAVAASGDFIAVGVQQAEVGTTTNAGRVLVYDRSTTTSNSVRFAINNPSPGLNDQFGAAVGISGNLLAVGAPYDDPTGFTDSGTVYIFDLGSATPGTPILTISNPTPGNGDLFGFAVAISSEFVVVGAHLSDDLGIDAGNAYAFNLRETTPTAIPLNRAGSNAGDQFGYSVAIAGYRAVVGAPLDDGLNADEGRAFVYNLWSASRSTPFRTYSDPNVNTDERFGISVGISGNDVVVGASRNSGTATGAAYVFNSSTTSTVPVYTFINPIPSPTGFDEFGESVAITRNYVVVGAHFADTTTSQDAGRSFIYDLNNSQPTLPVSSLTHPTPAANDFYGESVAASSNNIVISAPFDDVAQVNQGSVRAYRLDLEAQRGEMLRFDNTSGVWTGLDFNETTPTQRVLARWTGGVWKAGYSGDIDGDSKFDLIGETTGGQVWVQLSSNNSVAPLGSWDSTMTDVKVIDLNDDGYDDLVSWHPGSAAWYGLISNGSYLTLTHLATWSDTAGFTDFLVDDFFGDQIPDLMARSADGLWWITSRTRTATTTQVWGVWATTFGGNPILWQDVASDDYTGDGRADVVGRFEVAGNTRGDWWVSSRPSTALATNQYAGAWLTTAGWTNVNFVDVTGDNRADIWGVNSSGQWNINSGTNFNIPYTTTPNTIRRAYGFNIDTNSINEIIMTATNSTLRVIRGNTSSWTLNRTLTWTTGNWLFEGLDDRLW